MASAQPSQLHGNTSREPAATARVRAVSFLNAKPLIEGLADARTSVHFDVPAKLLDRLEADEADVALCPVIDYFRASRPLQLVPAGGIGCFGRTLTVRLFSRVPLKDVQHVHGDPESHTSLALLRIVMAKLYGREVTLDCDTPPAPASDGLTADSAEAVLLIGDKVITAAPSPSDYPYRLDLGEAWYRLTGLPFVFAAWMAPADRELGDLPRRLEAVRRQNAAAIGALVERYAPAHGWPIELARQYLGAILHYEIGPKQHEAIERFATLACQYGLNDQNPAIRLAPLPGSDGIS